MKKKILVFVDWYLPGFRAGGPVRSCANLVAHLSREFDFYIVATDTDYMSEKPYEFIKQDEWNDREDGSKVYYISKGNLNSQTIKKVIEEREYDCFYINGVFSYFFTKVALQYIPDKKKAIVVVRGMLSPNALAIKSFKKKVYLDYVKIARLFHGVIFQATSEEEKTHILKVFSKNRVEVVPNLSQKSQSDKLFERKKKQGELKLLSVARIAPEKNLLYALDVLKEVKQPVQFDFYGSLYDTHYAEQCFNAIASLPENINVSYKSEIHPDKLTKLMQEYHFLFLPTRGENFGHVIVEALSAGLPVIISNATPWKELQDAGAGWDISLDDQKEFTKVIEKCVDLGQQEYSRLSEGAFSYSSRINDHTETINLYRKLFS